MYHLERVRERAEAHVRANDYASVAWHVEQGGTTLTEGITGLADPNTGTPLPDDPIYRIFSMTKPLVSAVGVMLIDEGRLRLSDPVSMYLPLFADMQVMDADGTTRPARDTMLVEHLFTHRSGVTYQWQVGNPVTKLYPGRVRFAENDTLEELVTSLAELPLFAEPGTVWHYSYSTDILAHLIATIEGRPIDTVLRERIFAPLGMDDTGFFVPEAERGRILPVFGDANLPGAVTPVGDGGPTLSYGPPHMAYPADNPTYMRGGMGLFSTMGDFRKATRFLIGGCDAGGARMVSKAGVRALWTNRLPESQLSISVRGLPKYKGFGFGLGGRVLVHPSQSPFYGVEGECGWEGAATTYFWLDPRNDVTGIVMTQYIGQKFPLGEEIKSAFYQALE